MRLPFVISDHGKLVDKPYGLMERLAAKIRKEIQEDIDRDIIEMLMSFDKSGNNKE